MFSAAGKWKKRTTNQKIAIAGTIVVPIILAIIGWIISRPSTSTTVKTSGSNNHINVAGNGGTINTGVDVDRYRSVCEENGASKDKIRRLEEELSLTKQTLASFDQQEIPRITPEAKKLAVQIGDDAGPYAQALKAIAMGDAKRADEQLDKAQRVLDAVQGAKDAEQVEILVARIQNALYAGRPRDALQYCDQLESLAGNDSYLFNEIGRAHYYNADYQKAETFYKRSLAILENAPDPNHLSVARLLNDLALLYYSLGQYAQAESFYKRALEILEKTLGSDHPDVAASLNNLALLYKTKGQYAQAETLYKRSLAIFKNARGFDSPLTATILNNLAALYDFQGQYALAEPLYNRALENLTIEKP